MFGRKRSSGGKRKRRAPRNGWWSAIAAVRRRWIFRTSAYLVMAVAFLGTVAAGMTQLEAHVEREARIAVDRGLVFEVADAAGGQEHPLQRQLRGERLGRDERRGENRAHEGAYRKRASDRHG